MTVSRHGIGPAELLPCLLGVEQPVDAGAGSVSGLLPGADFGDESLALADAPIPALAAQQACFDLYPVAPTGVLECVMECQPPQDAMSLRWRKGFIGRAWRVERQSVLHHADQSGLRIMNVAQIVRAVNVVPRHVALGDCHMAPRSMRKAHDKQIDRAVAHVFVIVAFRLPRVGRDRQAHPADQLGWALVEADHRRLGIGRLNIQNAPHVMAPWRQRILGQVLAHRFSRKVGMIGY